MPAGRVAHPPRRDIHRQSFVPAVARAWLIIRKSRSGRNPGPL
jgi:hypothetical protein